MRLAGHGFGLTEASHTQGILLRGLRWKYQTKSWSKWDDTIDMNFRDILYALFVSSISGISPAQRGFQDANTLSISGHPF